MQKHRLLGAEFDYHVGGLGWCRGRVAKVSRGGLLEVHYKDLPSNAGRPQAAQTFRRARGRRLHPKLETQGRVLLRRAAAHTFATWETRQPGAQAREARDLQVRRLPRFTRFPEDRTTTAAARPEGLRGRRGGPRALAASDDDVASSASPTPTPPSSDSPRAVGTTKRFKCPAGCDRFFTHAPAAVQHGRPAPRSRRPRGRRNLRKRRLHLALHVAARDAARRRRGPRPVAGRGAARLAPVLLSDTLPADFGGLVMTA